MRIISAVALGAMLVSAPRDLTAQTASPADSARAPQGAGDMPSLVRALSGHWTLALQFEPTAGPHPGPQGSGEETWHAGLQGLTFTDEESFTVAGQTVTVLGLLWQDRRTNGLHALECSNQESHVCDLTGAVDGVVVQWTGSTLTIDEKELSQGKVMTSRVTWSDITANSFTETGYLAPPDGPFQKVVTFHATRAAAQ